MPSNSGSVINKIFFVPERENHNILYHYQGIIEYKTIDTILNKALQAIEQSGIDVKLQKKSFRIMMETLENIQKHSKNISHSNFFPQFFIFKNEQELIFKTYNFIVNEKKHELAENIEYINSLNLNRLKEIQEDKLINGKLTTKGGSGIGLINIAIRSRNKLNYLFETIDKESSQFVLQIKINIK